MDTNARQPVEVFISYCHKDNKLFRELQDHLVGLEKEKLIISWCDKRIVNGDPLDENIDEHLNSAPVILLLISPNYIASHYCYDIEMPRAMERFDNHEAQVIPIIMQPTEGLKQKPFYKLKALPTDGHPVTDRKHWQTRGFAFNDIVEGVRNTITEKFRTFTISIVPSAKPTGRPAIWNVPFNRNPNFTGRKEYLVKLHKALLSGSHAALTQSVTGLGGIGKTQIAREYAHEHAGEYFIVWWLHSETSEGLASDYAALAGPLDLPEKEQPEMKAVIAAVRRRLEKNRDWLLVFDNAPDPKAIREYLPTRGKGHIIITSRDPNWSGVAEPMALHVMEEPEAVEFLLKRTDKSDRAAAAELAKALGYFPLALEQAGAYIDVTGMPISRYIKICCEKKTAVLPGGCPTDYEATVATTWEINFKAVEERSPSGAALLKLCAFLAPDNIPLQIIRDGAKLLPEPLATTATDPLSFEEAVGALRRHSLIERTDDIISVHRIVQMVTREKMKKNEKKKWATAAVRIVNNVFPDQCDDVRTWPVCDNLFSHALAATEQAIPLGAGMEEVSRLMFEVGTYLSGRADFTVARSFFEKTIKIGEDLYGPDHPNVAIFVNNLGLVLYELGDYTGARVCYERALKIGETANDINHPHVATYVNNLGSVLKNLGDLEGARRCNERALKINEATLGPDHPNVASCVNNLGLVLYELGDLAGARKHFERTLKIDEATLGQNHPKVATCVNNLGLVLQDLGDLVGAQTCYERALKIDEAAFGQDHPEVATDVNNLGSVLYDLGDLAGARACLDRAFAIRKKSLGENHPITIKTRKSLEAIGG